ncbi:neurogenic locus notch protein [Echinococcus multilocularis]|uniref:Neurogenic locus notch protein n=1 Tax=Echinococcus multilocularis TaxID=6211 RepID=A0A087VYE6_ECHMU|nr:neurogenic locus notch protein [Echinococcus multilocularis]
MAWDLVEGANYEVPKYLREKNYIPTNWKDHCAPGSNSMGDDYMLHDFSEDDSRQPKSVLNLVSKYQSYWNGDWLKLFLFFYNLCYCLRGLKTDRTCPNACWRPQICTNDSNSVHICRPLRNPSAAEALHPSRKSRFSEIYSIGYECVCRSGFKFSQKRKKCIQLKTGCNDKRYGKTPCRNKGVCQPLKPREQTLQSLSFKCICPPAWQGYVCEAPRNPCQYQSRLCKDFPCQRDPTNEALGYVCACSKGYEPTSQVDPTCVNINECQDEDANPCLNGGICHDLIPPPMVQAKQGEEFRFRCECKFGFTGILCEKPPAQLTWSEWRDWGACSVSCGIGTRTRIRTCPRPGECLGKPEQTGICNGRVLSCENVKNTTTEDGKSDIVYRSEEEKLREAGVLWTEADENFLDDAFTWSEQQFNVKRGKMRKGTQSMYQLFRQWADVTRWIPLFGITQRMTLRRVALITGSLALASIGVFVILVVSIILCQPSGFAQRNKEPLN